MRCGQVLGGPLASLQASITTCNFIQGRTRHYLRRIIPWHARNTIPLGLVSFCTRSETNRGSRRVDWRCQCVLLRVLAGSLGTRSQRYGVPILYRGGLFLP